VSLVLLGGAVRDALGPPADLALSLAPWVAADPGLGPTVARISADPLNWRLTIPLGAPGQPLGPALLALNPVPALTAVSPGRAVAGTRALTLTVSGTSFVPGSAVTWNGAARPTTYVGPGSLQAVIGASDLARPRAAQIGVVNPVPGGGASAPLAFTVARPPRPRALSAPRLIGVARLGAGLRCTTGRWTNPPIRFTWRWLRAGRPIAGETRRTHRVSAADLARSLACRVGAANAGGAARARSRPVAVRGLHVGVASRRPLALTLRLDARVAVRASVQARLGDRWRTLATATLSAGRGRLVVRTPPRAPLRVAYRVGHVLRYAATSSQSR
jgi:hypothetical protein